jgi:hypothetical protein
MRDGINIAKDNQLIGQQPKRPVLASGGRRRASQREQMGLSFPVQFALSPTGRAATMQRCILALFNEALANTMNGLATDFEGISDSFISPGRTLGSTISLEQDLCVGTGTARCCAGVDQFAKLNTFISSQGYLVFSRHRVGYLQATDVEVIACWMILDFPLLTKYRFTHY